MLAEKQKLTIKEKYKDLLWDIDNLEGKIALRQVKTRVNQSVFRTMVLTNYNSKCCITGMHIPQYLVASHIVPWSKNEKERLNPRNGLCLNVMHDKAFDQGLLTITPDYKIKVSNYFEKLSADKTIQDWFVKFNNQPIIKPHKFLPSKEFLDSHFTQIFNK